MEGEIPPSSSLRIEVRAFDDPEAGVLLATADVLLLGCRVDDPDRAGAIVEALRGAERLRPERRRKAVGAVLLWGTASAWLAASLDHPAVIQDASLSGRALRAAAARLRMALSSVAPPSLLARLAEAHERARQADDVCAELRRQLVAAERTAEAAIAEQTRASRQLDRLTAELAALRALGPQSAEASPAGAPEPASGEQLPPDFADDLRSLDSLYEQLTGG
jgi:hypothetical protein